mgnify:CR=1 FL=1
MYKKSVVIIKRKIIYIYRTTLQVCKKLYIYSYKVTRYNFTKRNDMIDIKCTTADHLKLSELAAFQGDLKHRSQNDINELKQSISVDGLLMPFAVWKDDNTNKLLDGHGRLLALTDLALIDNEIAEQELPVIYIAVDSEEKAREALLQITSSYGKITRAGAIKFCAMIPEYRAPSINKLVHKPVSTRKAKIVTPAQPDKVILRIAIPPEKEQAIRELFGKTGYIEVL